MTIVEEDTMESQHQLTEKTDCDANLVTASDEDSSNARKHGTKENDNSELNLREWSPLSNLLSKIPQKAQKGLATLELNLTCIGATSEFLALGTNVGLIYWYNRKDDSLQRLKVENNNSSITTLRLVSSADYMLAAGNQDGIIAIFQIPIIDEHDEEQVETVRRKPVQRYMVHDLHKCPITALEWSSNGMKLFSGDCTGNVVLTELDYCLGISKSIHLLDETKEIVQLSYAHMNLLISSVFRTIIYSLETKQSHKVGSQDRKSLGNYGAVFESGLWSKTNKIFASRPGARLWVASLNGTVEFTANFKELIGNPHPYIPIINPSLGVHKRGQDIQLGILFHFIGKYLVTTHKNVLYIIDPTNMRILSSCHELKSILGLAVNRNEVFVLESSRNVVRISDIPDELLSRTDNCNSAGRSSLSSVIPDIMSASIADFRIPQQPFTYLTSKLKETSRALPKIYTTILNTTKNVIEADINIIDGQLTIIPPVIPLHESNIPNITVDESSIAEDYIAFPIPETKFDNVSTMPYEDVLAAQFRPEKHTRRNKKKKSSKASSYEISDSMSVSSFYSSNSEGDNGSTFNSSTSGIDIRQGMRESPHLPRKSSTDSSLSSTFADIPCSSTTTSFYDESLQEFDSVKTIHYISIPSTLEPNAKFFADVSHNDMEIKEEILAKRLNWPELLPASAQGKLTAFYQDEKEEQDADLNANRESSESSSNRETPETLKDDSFTLQSVGEEPILSVFPVDTTLDIYTRCSPREDSISSNFSIGPPSGSSNINSLNTEDSRSLLDDLEQNKKELMELQNTDGCSSSSKVSNSAPQDMKVDAVVGNDHWLQYKLPGNISSVAVCDKFVLCSDSKNVYYSQLGELSLHWIKLTYNATSLAISPCGSIVWRVYKNVLYSLTSPSPAKDVNWMKVHENVVSMSLQRKQVGWIVKKDGSLSVWTTAHKSDTTSPEFDEVLIPQRIAQISTQFSSVLALTIDGKVLVRRGITDGYALGIGWVELNISLPSIFSITAGPCDSIWICDIHNSLYFIKDFKEISSTGEKTAWKVSISEYIFPKSSTTSNASASNWKTKLSESFKSEKLSCLLSSKTLPLLCGSSSFVWFTCTGSNTIYVNKTSVMGHSWQNISVDSGLKANNWSNVFAGSIYHHYGYLWLLDPKGKLCYCSPTGGKLQALDTPSSDPVVSVAPAPEALWILNSQGHVYGRCNITSTNVVGYGWDRIQLSPHDGVHFVHISCGSEIAWACDTRGDIFMRIGSLQPPSTTDMSPAWVQVEGSPSTSQNSIFTKVYVGNTGHIVWALDNYKNIYVREAVYPELPIGTRWILVSGIEAIRLTISDNAVWALTPKLEIFRRYGISKTNFVGEYWRKVPGVATVLTASLCDEIWALDASGAVLKHSYAKLKLSREGDGNQCTKTLDEEDSEWELVG